MGGSLCVVGGSLCGVQEDRSRSKLESQLVLVSFRLDRISCGEVIKPSRHSLRPTKSRMRPFSMATASSSQ